MNVDDYSKFSIPIRFHMNNLNKIGMKFDGMIHRNDYINSCGDL